MISREHELSHEKLLSLLKYNPETGEFTWINGIKGKSKAGKVAGSRSKNYIIIKINGIPYNAHRMACFYMTGSWPVECMDHIDRNKHNNKWSNLRQANRCENSRNRSAPSNSSSGLLGVCKVSKSNLWRAVIKHNGKQIHLGRFKTLEEASKARKMAEVKYFGDFSSS